MSLYKIHSKTDFDENKNVVNSNINNNNNNNINNNNINNKKEKKLIIYHNDLDGYYSAISYAILDSKIDDEIVNKAIDEFNVNDYLELLTSNYDFFYADHNNKNLLQKLDDIGFDLDDYDSLILVDFSDTLEVMKYFKNKFGDQFIWIDHHKNVYETYKNQIEIKGLRDCNFAASRLVWKYFNKETPEVIRYVEDQDIWKWELKDSRNLSRILNFTYDKKDVMYNYDHLFKLINKNIFDSKKDNFILKGTTIKEYVNKESKTQILKSGKVISFQGYNAFIINTQLKAGDISDIFFNNKEFSDVEVVIAWFRLYNADLDKVSLRSKSDNVDVSKIANKYGGNGHPKASGFVIDDIKNL